MNSLKMFVPLSKIDVEKRLVYGIATGETADRSGEICDYATTKPFYESWSDDIAKASGGRSFGNVRAMHGSVAAGVVKSIAFNDESKQIEIAAKIVDDNEWQKVQEGVYTGFSQGGGYVKRWKDPVTGLQRYTASPSEVSLVDLPCLPTATFQMIKAAGAVEERHFKSVVEVKQPTNDEVNAKAVEMAKAAGRETSVADFFAPAREALMKAALPAPAEAPEPNAETGAPNAPADGLEQVWKARDGKTFAKKADAVAHNAALDAADNPSVLAVIDKLDDVAGKLGITKADAGGDAPGNGTKKPGEGKDQTSEGGASAMNAASKKRKRKGPPATAAEKMAKSLYAASRFAELLASLKSLQQSVEYEALLEGDDDDEALAEQFEAWVAQGCTLLVAIIQDEADDMGEADDDTMAMAAGKLKAREVAALVKACGEIEPLKKIGEAVAKAGARNSAADQEKIQAMHDHACDLGATCKSGDASKNAGGGDDLAKALDIVVFNKIAPKLDLIAPAFAKLHEELVALRKENAVLRDDMAIIKAQPMPLPLVAGTPRVFTKGAEGSADDRPLADRLAEMREKDPAEYQLLMIKVAQQNPQTISYAR